MVRLNENATMVSLLEAAGIIRTKEVRDAMLSTPRELFVWRGSENYAYSDRPLPLGSTGQTISAPHMVALMLEGARLASGSHVLEVGCGSGYNAACMAFLVGDTGRVVTLEVNRELVRFAQSNIRKLPIESLVEIHESDGNYGWPPAKGVEVYDRIVITAGTPEVPPLLLTQLRKGGIMLIPIGEQPVQVLTRLVKDSKGVVASHMVCECAFVPLTRPPSGRA